MSAVPCLRIPNNIFSVFFILLCVLKAVLLLYFLIICDGVYVVTCTCEVSPLLSLGVHIHVMFSVFMCSQSVIVCSFLSIVFCYGNRDVYSFTCLYCLNVGYVVCVSDF